MEQNKELAIPKELEVGKLCRQKMRGLERKVAKTICRKKKSFVRVLPGCKEESIEDAGKQDKGKGLALVFPFDVSPPAYVGMVLGLWEDLRRMYKGALMEEDCLFRMEPCGLGMIALTVRPILEREMDTDWLMESADEEKPQRKEEPDITDWFPPEENIGINK